MNSDKKPGAEAPQWTEDERLTALAEGQLAAEEQARLEAQLSADPAGRAELEARRAWAATLRTTLGAERAAWSVEDAGRHDARHAEASAPRESESARGGESWWRSWGGPALLAACLVLVASALLLPTVGRVRESSRRTVDSSNLRQIGYAVLIAASDFGDTYPVAQDGWGYAEQLARHGGMNDASLWVSRSPLDPAAEANAALGLSTVLAKDGLGLDANFRQAKLAWAVALFPPGTRVDKVPSTTPIAWTRGLRADGTWATHSPNSGEGGHVVYAGGNVWFMRRVQGEFIHAQTGEKTSSVAEALPPGTRIWEYTPSAEEAAAWSAPGAVRARVVELQTRNWLREWGWTLGLAGVVVVGVILRAVRLFGTGGMIVFWVLGGAAVLVLTPTVARCG
jgi:hypothetical protein